MKQRLEIGPAPCDEEYTRVGDPGYSTTKALADCRRFITLIRSVCGIEPEGAKLIVNHQPYPQGTYFEVMVQYETEFPDACKYAFQVEGYAPARWSAAIEFTQDDGFTEEQVDTLKSMYLKQSDGTSTLQAFLGRAVNHSGMYATISWCGSIYVVTRDGLSAYAHGVTA